MSTGFQREDRYVVLKRTDLDAHASLADRVALARTRIAIEAGRASAQKNAFECLVIESDWPEYEPAWAAIEARMRGLNEASGNSGQLPDQVRAREFIASRTPSPEMRQDVLDGDYDQTEWFGHVQAALAQQAGAVEPVGWQWRWLPHGGWADGGSKEDCEARVMNWTRDGVGDRIQIRPVYAAPQPAIPEGVIPAPKRHPSPDPDTGEDRGSCCAHAHADGWNECRAAVIAALAQHNREGA